MDDEKVTTIISADYMYLVFLSDDETMSKIVNKLNATEEKLESDKDGSYKSNKLNKNRPRHIYIKTEVDSPCINILEDINIQKILRDDAIKLIKRQREKKKDSTISISKEDIDVNIKYVIMDEGVETAQCLTYADMSCGSNFDFFEKKNSIDYTAMLMVMVSNDTHYKLSYPILQLDEEENPADLIENWLREHDLKGLIKELTISPINMVGNEHDILVFSAIVG